jgi:hypothetical protein
MVVDALPYGGVTDAGTKACTLPTLNESKVVPSVLTCMTNRQEMRRGVEYADKNKEDGIKREKCLEGPNRNGVAERMQMIAVVFELMRLSTGR